jgi:hypothetical protein
MACSTRHLYKNGITNSIYLYCFIFQTGLDVKKVDKCMGDPNADSDHPLLKMEQDAQVNLPCDVLVIVIFISKLKYCKLVYLNVYYLLIPL